MAASVMVAALVVIGLLGLPVPMLPNAENRLSELPEIEPDVSTIEPEPEPTVAIVIAPAVPPEAGLATTLPDNVMPVLPPLIKSVV